MGTFGEFCGNIKISKAQNCLKTKQLTHYVRYDKYSLNPVPNAQMCVFDGTYYKMMLNDVGVHDIILYWFLFSLLLNL
jgi:hypothetical protein